MFVDVWKWKIGQEIRHFSQGRILVVGSEAGDGDVCGEDVYNCMETASISRENIALFNLLMEYL